MAEKITKRADDYSQWYLDVVQHAGLAENSGRMSFSAQGLENPSGPTLLAR